MIAARRYLSALLVCMLFGLSPTAPAADNDSDIALQRALDQQLTLNLDNTELSEAFKQIASAAKIDADRDKDALHDQKANRTTRSSAAKQHVKRMQPSKPITRSPGKVKIRKHK